MVLFWAENAVVGFYNLLKLVVVAKWGALFLGPFFMGHFGGFMSGHFLFIYYLFVRGSALPALLFITPSRVAVPAPTPFTSPSSGR